jgi:hypothetical protein
MKNDAIESDKTPETRRISVEMNDSVLSGVHLSRGATEDSGRGVHLPGITREETKRTPKIKEHKIRVVTQEKKWTVRPEDYTHEQQWNHLFGEDFEAPLRTLSVRQITAKIGGYRAQDLKNGLFDPEKFVDVESVLVLLKNAEMKCFYCKMRVQVLYQHVREPEQWTLERLDNDEGHNKSNVVIACLKCNLRRRCMYHERYVFTKQLSVVKLGGN